MCKDPVKFKKKDGIGTISLNRPERMNALNGDMIKGLSSLLDDISEDDEVKIIVLTGNRRSFSTGADIRELSKIESPRKVQVFFAMIKALSNKIENMGKPVIAAISGYALGGGCELALACDFRIAADNAVFGLPEIKLGLIPGGGGIQRLVRTVGITMAKELLYSGNVIQAEKALQIGLVSKVIKVTQLMKEVGKMSSRFLPHQPLTLKMMKFAINAGMDMNIGSTLNYEDRCIEMLTFSGDLREVINAFLEKGKPVFH